MSWLEGFLRNFQGAVVTVTHDRSLLEALAEWVVDVEFGGLRIYEGNYSSYLEQKSRALDGEKSKQVRRLPWRFVVYIYLGLQIREVLRRGGPSRE